MLRKILKWTGISVVILVMILFVAVLLLQHKTYEASYPQITASKDTAVIARGQHLVNNIAHCADCHSKVNADSLLALGLEAPLSGGLAFKLPVGTIYSANITSDKEYGIGKYSDAEIARVLRFGVHPDGEAVFDFMPFHNLCDADLEAVISYLRTQKPVHTQKPENEPNLLGKIVIAFLVKPVGPTEKIVPFVMPDSTAEYGRYLVFNVANCSGCHTQRGVSGEYTGELLAGGNPLKGLTPPNLTPHPSGRIYGWTEETFIKRFRMGKLNPKSEMPWNAFKGMTDKELKAIYNYLQTVPAVNSDQLTAKR